MSASRNAGVSHMRWRLRQQSKATRGHGQRTQANGFANAALAWAWLGKALALKPEGSATVMGRWTKAVSTVFFTNSGDATVRTHEFFAETCKNYTKWKLVSCRFQIHYYFSLTLKESCKSNQNIFMLKHSSPYISVNTQPFSTKFISAWSVSQDLQYYGNKIEKNEGRNSPCLKSSDQK